MTKVAGVEKLLRAFLTGQLLLIDAETHGAVAFLRRKYGPPEAGTRRLRLRMPVELINRDGLKEPGLLHMHVPLGALVALCLREEPLYSSARRNTDIAQAIALVDAEIARRAIEKISPSRHLHRG